MRIIDSTTSARLVEIDGQHSIERWHPRTGWFTAYPVKDERSGRASLGSHAELIGEIEELSAETLETNIEAAQLMAEDWTLAEIFIHLTGRCDAQRCLAPSHKEEAR